MSPPSLFLFRRQSIVGVCLLNGDGVAADLQRALHYLSKVGKRPVAALIVQPIPFGRPAGGIESASAVSFVWPVA
jgi:hypothetical protein